MPDERQNIVHRPKTLPAFTQKEKETAHVLLATQVVFMMGRKLEEADWSSVYCKAKGIPERGWSNLRIDVTYEGLGVEHKMLRVGSDAPIRTLCGTSPMHPSATRSIRIASTDANPNQVMVDVLTQYRRNLDERRAKIREGFTEKEPDLRTGWLLWQTSLTEFLYFEEEMLNPDPADYFAEWKESGGTGARKPSRTYGSMRRKPAGKDTLSQHLRAQRYSRILMFRRQTIPIFTCSGYKAKKSHPGSFAFGWELQPQGSWSASLAALHRKG